MRVGILSAIVESINGNQLPDGQVEHLIAALLSHLLEGVKLIAGDVTCNSFHSNEFAAISRPRSGHGQIARTPEPLSDSQHLLVMDPEPASAPDLGRPHIDRGDCLKVIHLWDGAVLILPYESVPLPSPINRATRSAPRPRQAPPSGSGDDVLVRHVRLRDPGALVSGQPVLSGTPTGSAI